MQHPDFLERTVPILLSTWSDELMKKVITKGFNLPEDYAEEFLNVSAGISRMLNTLVPAIENMETFKGLSEVPPLSYSGVKLVFLTAYDDKSLREIVKGKVPKKKEIELLEKVDLVKKASKNNQIVEVNGQGYQFRTEFLKKAVTDLTYGRELSTDSPIVLL